MSREPNTSILLQTLLIPGGERKAITNIYKALHMEARCALTLLRTYWEEALRMELTDAQWEQALMVPKIISVNARYYKYIQFNYLHNTYIASARLAQIYPSAADRCPRCHSGNANFLHMVWACPPVVEYWEMITETLNKITKGNTWRDMAHFLLGVTRRTPKNKSINKILDLALILAKRYLAMCWKSALPPRCQDGLSI
ncbi:hypothetical protein NDU88_001900 [Pleurodeles waltl]|uniref:Reverse transcriptase zinc-binding domain-containing protein n=1 Tax=Pleurodeles waltl TaxID=8319 RepID=A0AAV7TJ58_PLEWA|nr:hypothetical protein NDU88_001900 [Pleurodeles waltl]